MKVWHVVTLYALFRVAFRPGTELNAELLYRPEIDVPMTTVREHLEAYYLWERGINLNRCLPLVTLAVQNLHRHGLVDAFMLGCELAKALMLSSMVDGDLKTKAFVYSFFNPFNVLASTAQNLNSFTTTMMVLAFMLLLKGSHPLFMHN